MHESHNQPLLMRLGSSRVATLQGMRPIGLLLEAAKHEAVSGEEECSGAVTRERGKEDGTEEASERAIYALEAGCAHGGAGQPND
jgi:hypothetical protein